MRDLNEFKLLDRLANLIIGIRVNCRLRELHSP